MGYDLVTWNPRVSASGDSAYGWPGATQLDASVDTSTGQVGMQAGASDYSTLPTIAEINARNGLNQIIALVNRRNKNYSTSFGTSYSAVSYLTGRLRASQLTSLKTSIDAVRTQEGFAAYGSWPTAPVAGSRLLAGYMGHMRKALRIAGVMTIPIGTFSGGIMTLAAGCKFGRYFRIDNPYGTHTSESQSTGTGNIPSIGKTFTGSIARFRSIFSFPVAEYITGTFTASFVFALFDIDNPDPFLPEVWIGNADYSAPSLTPAYGGTYYNFDNLLFTGVASTGDQTASVSDTSKITSLAGSYTSFTLSTDDERTGVGSGTSNGFSQFSKATLTIDFGS